MDFLLVLVLTHSAPDDLAQPAQLRSLLKDLREARQAKIRTALHDEGAWKYPYLRVSPHNQVIKHGTT
jgi:GINS complex subunit 2